MRTTDCCAATPIDGRGVTHRPCAPGERCLTGPSGTPMNRDRPCLHVQESWAAERRAKKRREAELLRDVSAAESLRMGFSMIRFARRLRDRA